MDLNVGQSRNNIHKVFIVKMIILDGCVKLLWKMRKEMCLFEENSLTSI